MKQLSFSVLFIVAASLIFSACRKSDAALPDNFIQFESTELGFAAHQQETEVVLQLSRRADAASPITISIAENGITYGEGYTTVPAVENNKISILVPSGANTVSFKVVKAEGAAIYGDESLEFTIAGVAEPLIIGRNNKLMLVFDEIISAGNQLILNGGGAEYPNKVFVDLSANKQIPVLRTSWDLGFYSGDEFRVILNSSTAMMARAINKTDLNDVTAADTAGFGATMVFDQMDPKPEAMAFIDHPSGDLGKTAIAAIAANAEENKVYIINRGSGVGTPAPERGWKKVRILRNANGGYSLQHADIDATTYATIDIPKDSKYFFNYVSFENGLVNAEPEAKKWDLAWTYFSFATNFGFGEVPYLYQDIILQNRNVETVQVMESTVSYQEFNEQHLAGLNFSSLQTNIGSNWRSGGGPGVSPAVRTDRFYVVKDADGNVYKLKFTALTKDGERGYPAIEYALVKKGE